MGKTQQAGIFKEKKQAIVIGDLDNGSQRSVSSAKHPAGKHPAILSSKP